MIQMQYTETDIEQHALQTEDNRDVYRKYLILCCCLDLADLYTIAMVMNNEIIVIITDMMAISIVRQEVCMLPFDQLTLFTSAKLAYVKRSFYKSNQR